jgi:hypothetical protein
MYRVLLDSRASGSNASSQTILGLTENGRKGANTVWNTAAGSSTTIDFRKLNKCIKRKPFPIPKIQDMLLKLEGFQWATSPYKLLNARRVTA